jgi:hypothetical protein
MQEDKKAIGTDHDTWPFESVIRRDLPFPQVGNYLSQWERYLYERLDCIPRDCGYSATALGT